MILLAANAVVEHAFEIGLIREHVMNAALETLPLRQIQFERAKSIREEKLVDHHAGRIGKSGGLHDVHAPRSKDSGHPREEKRAVSRDKRQLIPLPPAR